MDWYSPTADDVEKLFCVVMVLYTNVSIISVVWKSWELLPTMFQNKPKLPFIMPPKAKSRRIMNVGLRLGRI